MMEESDDGAHQYASSTADVERSGNVEIEEDSEDGVKLGQIEDFGDKADADGVKEKTRGDKMINGDDEVEGFNNPEQSHEDASRQDNNSPRISEEPSDDSSSVKQVDTINHGCIGDRKDPTSIKDKDNTELPASIAQEMSSSSSSEDTGSNQDVSPEETGSNQDVTAIRIIDPPLDDEQQDANPVSPCGVTCNDKLGTSETISDGVTVDTMEPPSSNSNRENSPNSPPSSCVILDMPEAIHRSASKHGCEKSRPNKSESVTGTSTNATSFANATPRHFVEANIETPSETTKLVQTTSVQVHALVSRSQSEIKQTLPPCTVTQSVRTEVEELERNQDDDLLSELDAELEELFVPQAFAGGDPANGLLKRDILVEEIPAFKSMRTKTSQLQKQVEQQQVELKSMQDFVANQRQQVADLEEERATLKMKLKQRASVHEVHLVRIKEIEILVDQQKVEITAGRDRQLSHDAAAKKAISKLQQEMILRVDQVKCMYEEAIKEKEGMVIKYAKSEKEVLDQKRAREALDKRHKELKLMLESVNSQLKDAKKDRAKMKHTATSKETEASYLQKEIDQLKEEVSSQGIKVKWSQNKLKTELDSHKETKVRLAKTEQRLAEAKEETEQIRKNCQDMIKTYQTSEEVKSNSLDKQLKVKHSELEQKQQEQKDHLEVHQARLRELESLKKSLTDHIAELDSLKVKAKCLEEECLQSEELLAKFKELLNSQKEENRRLNRQLEEKKVLAQEVEDLKQSESQLRSEVSGQKVDQTDLEMELEVSREKESELLQFTQKITCKNTSLSSENSMLQSKTSQLQTEVQKLQSNLEELQTSYSQLSSDLKQERHYRERESSILTTKLNEKSRALEQLSIQLDEARDDNKTLKRKHVANTKDLTRQLQQVYKRLESLESTDNPSRDNISVGSRTSSSGSLDTIPGSNHNVVNSSGSSVSVTTSSSSRHEDHNASQDPTVAIASGNDYPGVDKGMLVDRIVRLQKAHLRKNEKIEFMQEHMTHLVEELKKKTKIIQQYIMRDESGALTSVASDVNKAQMSKQGGIMSSLYRSQQTDPGMTLDLSLEINRKLQAVLEATLLKNITLKENIETLGQEIARLLQQKQKTHQASSR